MKLKNILEVYTKRTSELNRYMQPSDDADVELQEINTVRTFVKCILFSLDHAPRSSQLNSKDLIFIIKFLIDADDAVVEIIHDCLIDIHDNYVEDDADPQNVDPIFNALRAIGLDDFYRIFSDIRSKLDAPGIFQNMFWYHKIPEHINDKLVFAFRSIQANGISSGHTKTLLSLKKSKILPPETWVVHFSRNAKEVAEHGFKYGTPTKHNLSLTTMLPKSTKTGGYNFGFLADGSTARNYADEHNSHYGNEFVMFQAAGSLFDHKTDIEEQFIFDGAALNHRNFVYVRYQYPVDHNDADGPVKQYQVLNYNTGKPIYIGDFVAVVRWIEHNFLRYKNLICPGEGAAKVAQREISKPKG